MNTITIDRAIVEQALEALEAFLSDELRPYDAAKTSAALRAALAEQSDWPICHHCGQMMHPEPLRREHE